MGAWGHDAGIQELGRCPDHWDHDGGRGADGHLRPRPDRGGSFAQPARAAAGRDHPFLGVRGYLRGRACVAQVALFDAVTGRTYLLSEGPDTQYTASIVKADILAFWLHRYQRHPGTIPASIPYSIRYLMTNMITVSDNVAATSLFYFGGGCAALTRFDTLVPTRHTDVGLRDADVLRLGQHRPLLPPPIRWLSSALSPTPARFYSDDARAYASGS